MELTDKDSLYRKLYNRSLPFFTWVIDEEPEPYVFKLHIQALTLKELTIPSVRYSVESLIPFSKGKSTAKLNV
jgi:hypothetical protein